MQNNTCYTASISWFEKTLAKRYAENVVGDFNVDEIDHIYVSFEDQFGICVQLFYTDGGYDDE